MSHSKMVIFAIDDLQRDRAFVEELQRNFEGYLNFRGLEDRYKKCIGSYNGLEERSYIMPVALFDKWVRNSFYVEDQESFLTITGCNKAYAELEYTDGRPNESLGSLQQVDEAIARTYPSWTCRLDTNAWYICAYANPDHSHEIGPYTGA